jgi:hypothetical protein
MLHDDMRVRALCGGTRDARVRPPGPDGLAGRGVGRHPPVRTRVKAVHVLVSDGSECRTLTTVQCTGAVRIRVFRACGNRIPRAARGERRVPVQLKFTYHDSLNKASPRVPSLSTGHCSPVAQRPHPQAQRCRAPRAAALCPLVSRRLAASTPHWPRVVARGHC